MQFYETEYSIHPSHLIKDIEISPHELTRNRISTEQLRTSIDKITKNNSDKKTFSCSDLFKRMVSKKKCRIQKNGLDLDLTYITDQIIAMGFPAEEIEAVYRNSLKDTKSFLDSQHPNHYKVYNLCQERQYNHSNFNYKVAEYPFCDHQAPPFQMIFEFCMDVDYWLSQHPQNVAAIHCKAGKGRTGIMICCYLLYSKLFAQAIDSLRYYGMIRTKNGKVNNYLINILREQQYLRKQDTCTIFKQLLIKIGTYLAYQNEQLN